MSHTRTSGHRTAEPGGRGADAAPRQSSGRPTPRQPKARPPSPRQPKAQPPSARPPSATARGVALEALARIDEGAYANLVLPGLLARSGLSRRDRAFATELTYGTTRMRRACDWLVDAHLTRPVEPVVRAALRLGAYQLAMAGTPAHAAVSETVDETPKRARGLVNAVLRKVATVAPRPWPDVATRLSYPDWVVERLVADLGGANALAALTQMNEAPPVTEREDGYIQDMGSQQVSELVGVATGDRVADLCAAPGGKATLMASSPEAPALVVGADIRPARAALVRGHARKLALENLATVVADGRRAPLRSGSLDAALVDAPCSGLGVLRRRPDARWRIEPADVERLARLQRQLLEEAAGLVRLGGTVTYSVCTLTSAETLRVDEWLVSAHPELVAAPVPGPPWARLGRGALLVPQAAGTDGLYLLRLSKAR
ncbi:MAG: rRNA cytosine-C5-methyltransferase [Acidimicrobiales bacterium]|nr:MAG: rRNA cytosine-C5-methyltransferase [Acidimicrobiales bacterium]